MKIEKFYTVFVDGELWTNVIDDMNTTASWAEGGIIFLKKKFARDFIKDTKQYDQWEKSEFKIVEVYFKP